MSENKFCPHCGERADGIRHVLVLEEDWYCDQCWEAVLDDIDADYGVSEATPAREL